MKIRTSGNAFPKILSCNLFTKSALFLKHRVDLSLGTILQYQVKIIVILVVVVQLKDMVMVQLVHDLDLQLDLLNQVVLKNLFLVDDLDGEDVLGYLMSYFVDLAEATDSDVGVGEGLKVILPAFSLFTPDHRWRKKQYPILNVIHFVLQLWWDLYWLYNDLFLLF